MGKKTLSEEQGFLDRLYSHFVGIPDKHALTYLGDSTENPVQLSYQELGQAAFAVAAHLKMTGASGERALLLFPSGVEYIVAFLGCLLAGVIAVPAYSPRPNRPRASLSRIWGMIDDCQPKFALTTSGVLAKLEGVLADEPRLQGISWMATDTLSPDLASNWEPKLFPGSDVAYLQYTSGSTSAPRGVKITHDNIFHTVEYCITVGGPTADGVHCTWLPLYHDLGLVAGVLTSLYMGMRFVFMDPVAFLQRPVRWLQMISDYRGTVSAAPNFAYDFCARRVTTEEKQGLDLSSWVMTVNAAEPVRGDTLNRFFRAFQACGFKMGAFCPAYGLAEATLTVSGVRWDSEPWDHLFDGKSLKDGKVVPVFDGAVDAYPLVSCGPGMAGEDIRIVDPDSGTLCESDEIGEIWVAGPNVSPGYWRDSQESLGNFGNSIDGLPGSYLRTGDLGFIYRDELFITGRLKDMLIIRGHNHYPQDIELTVQNSHPALMPDSGAAFSMEIEGGEALVILQELRRDQLRKVEPKEIVQSIREVVARKHDVAVHEIVLLRPASLPRTTSGKVQRYRCRELFEQGTLRAIHQWGLQQSTDYAGSLIGKPLETEWLKSLNPAERREIIYSVFEKIIKEITLNWDVEIDPAIPISYFGLDSLARFEFTLRVEVQLGVQLSLKQVSDPDLSLDDLVQTIEAIIFDTAESISPSRNDIVDEFIPFTQYQRFILEHEGAHPEKYLLRVTLRTPPGVDVEAVQAAWRHLESVHDIFRLRVVKREEGWLQFYDQAGHGMVFKAVDAANEQAGIDGGLAERVLAEMNQQIDIQNGPIACAYLLDRGPEESGLLLLMIHHLFVDYASLVILISQFQRAYHLAMSGKPLAPVAATTPYRRWIQAFWQQAQSGPVRAELDYWKSVGEKLAELPKLSAFGSAKKEGYRYRSSKAWQLGNQTTKELLRKFPQAVDRQAVFLAAMASAWRSTVGVDKFAIQVVDNGRKLEIDGLDLSRSLGLFFHHYPLVIDMENCPGALDILDLVNETLQRVPRFGVGFGQLAHLAERENGLHDLNTYSWPKVSLHYRSFIEQFFRQDDRFKVIDRRVENIPQLLNPEQAKYFNLELWVLQERHKTNWFLNYDPWRYGEDWINRMGDLIGVKVDEIIDYPGQSHN